MKPLNAADAGSSRSRYLRVALFEQRALKPTSRPESIAPVTMGEVVVRGGCCLAGLLFIPSIVTFPFPIKSPPFVKPRIYVPTAKIVDFIGLIFRFRAREATVAGRRARDQSVRAILEDRETGRGVLRRGAPRWFLARCLWDWRNVVLPGTEFGVAAMDAEEWASKSIS